MNRNLPIQTEVRSALERIREDRVINSVHSLVVLIVAVLGLTCVSFVMFWTSDTRDLVNDIQAAGVGKKNSTSAAMQVDDDGKLSVAELLHINEKISDESSKLDPQVDFGAAGLGSDSLGL